MTSARQSAAASEQKRRAGSANLIAGFHGVRHQSRAVARAVEFYTRHLSFKLEHQQLPAVEDPDGNPVEVFAPQRS